MAVDFIPFSDKSEAELEALLAEFYDPGFRCTSLSIYGTTDHPRYAAVMVRSANPPTQLPTLLLSRLELQDLIPFYQQHKLTPAIIAAMGSTADPRFAVIWEPADDPLAQPVFDLTTTTLANLNITTRFLNLTATAPVLLVSQIPVSLAVYGDPDDRRYAVVLRTNAGAADWDCTGMADTDFQYGLRQITQQSAYNRPSLVSLASDLSVASVFRNDRVGEWVALPQLLTEQGLHQALTTYCFDGDYYPVAIAGSGSGQATRYATIFATSDQVTPRTFSVTGSTGPEDQYDQAVYRVMKDYGIHQAALALVQGTHLVLARGYSYAEPGYPSAGAAQVTADKMLFRLASCSKVFTSILMHRLIQSHKLSLTDLLVDVLDIKPLAGQSIDKRFSTITIWDLLQMASGINPNVGDLAVAQAVKKNLPISPAEFASYIACQPLQHLPGTRGAALYNNTNFALLGQVIERLTYQRYAGAVQELICEPLHMSHTRLAIPNLADQPADEAFYDTSGIPLQQTVMSPDQQLVPFGYGTSNFEVHAGDAGLSATAVDLARVLAALSIHTDSSPILSAVERDSMFSDAQRGLNALSGGPFTPAGYHGAQGWDACSLNPGPGNWYANKGGSEAGAGAVMRLSMGGISMAFVVSHQPVGPGAPQSGPPGQPATFPDSSYPDWPSIIHPAEHSDWGDIDLFPSFGMPTLLD